jgi:hypothetical protein
MAKHFRDVASGGLLVDLAHASERTFADVLELSPPGTAVVTRGAGLFTTRRGTWRTGSFAPWGSTVAWSGSWITSFMPLTLPGTPPSDWERTSLTSLPRRSRNLECQPASGLPKPAAGGTAFGLDGLPGPGGLQQLVTELGTRGLEPTTVEAILAGNWRKKFQDALCGAPLDARFPR